MLGANPNLHKLPIYQEVEKVSGNVFVTDDLVSVSKSSNIFLACFLSLTGKTVVL